MPKGLSLPKDFSRFQPSKNLNLLFLQTFSFGVYNARLQLKNERFRYSDVLTILIVGEMNENGCKVSDFKNIVGSQTSISSNTLNRAKTKGVVRRIGGYRGRGNAARYYLTDTGNSIFRTLQKELGKTLYEAKKEFLRETIKRSMSI